MGRQQGRCREGMLTMLSCLVLMKNCEPPELGWPVLAIERVPGSLEISATSSSGMLPPPSRAMVLPSGVVNEVPPSGPPVPARGDLGSLEWGQPNWHTAGVVAQD